MPKDKLLVLTTPPEQADYSHYCVVNIGPWCKNESDIELNRSLEDFPLIFSKDTIYTDNFVDRIIGPLGDALNNVHNKTHSIKYWRAILSSWLAQFVGTLVDRIGALKFATEGQHIDSILISKQAKRVVPENTYHSMKLCADSDSFNQYLFERIYFFLFKSDSHSFKYFKEGVEPDILTTQNLKGRILNTRRNIVFKFLKLISRFRKVLVTNTAMSVSLQKKILFKTSILPFFATNDFVGKGAEINDGLRLFVRDRISDIACNKKEVLLIDLICHFLPKNFVEDFSDFYSYSSKAYNLAFQKLFIGVELYNNSSFMHFVGISRENGATVKGIQHGGRSGTEYTAFQEIVEHKNVDCFYTWGWKWVYQRDFFELKPMPSPKLIDQYLLKDSNASTNGMILFGITSVNKFVSRIGAFDNVYSVKKYMKWQRMFMYALDLEARSKFILRGHDNERGWNYSEQLKLNNITIKFDKHDKSFKDSLESCELYVSDHLSTTWIESLFINKPTILYWDNIYNINKHTRYYFEELKRVSILHDSSLSAAKIINDIHDDVETWWQDKERQEVVQKVCKKFAIMTDDPIHSWIDELNNF